MDDEDDVEKEEEEDDDDYYNADKEDDENELEINYSKKQKRKKKIKSRQLSVKQTNESRRNTKVKYFTKTPFYVDILKISYIKIKVRFIIEKQNGTLKNHKKLDNTRNTELGHVQIDYRIACAMDNFLHKHCCPDGEHALEVAKRIRIKAQYLEENKLAFFIRRQLGTSLIPSIDLSEINDFPIIKRKTLKKKGFYGNFPA
jgi:hypothetical protein